MKIPIIHRIDRQDLAGAGELPGWIDKLLASLNGFIEPVGKAIQGNITLADNLSGKQFSYKFTHGVEAVINTGSNLRVTGVMLIDTGGLVVTGFGIARKTNGLGLTVKFDGGSGTTTSTCVFYVLLG